MPGIRGDEDEHPARSSAASCVSFSLDIVDENRSWTYKVRQSQ